jgi:hypothetical protein
MRPKLQKHSVLEFASRIIPRSGGYNTPQLAAEPVSKACFGFHTRDLFYEKVIISFTYNCSAMGSCQTLC